MSYKRHNFDKIKNKKLSHRHRPKGGWMYGGYYFDNKSKRYKRYYANREHKEYKNYLKRSIRHHNKAELNKLSSTQDTDTDPKLTPDKAGDLWFYD
jgi:hypothetical protein